MKSENIVKIENVSKIYKQGKLEVLALKNINFSVNQGEFVALTGPSGSGKTTLLNQIGLLDKPTTGNIMIDGEDITRLNEKEATVYRLNHLGFVFQSYNLIPVMTALENICFVLELQGMLPKEAQEIGNTLMEQLGLADLGSRFPKELSGGQQQRVAVARALVSNPALILADEPTANLDGKNASSLLDMMERMCSENNVTFIFSTHDSRVMARAHRLINLEDGKIESDSPNNQFSSAGA